MNWSRDYVFVFWGDGFEEAVAAIFVTTLRNAGLRVKVIGLTRRLTKGSHGLALVPDLILDQALSLASQAICLVIPCLSPALKRLKDDPRLPNFFQQARARGASVIIGPLDEADASALGLLLPAHPSLIYLDPNQITELAEQVADSLLQPEHPV